MSGSSPEAIGIAFAIDGNYVIPLAAAVRSIVDNCATPERIEVVVLARDVAQRDRDLVVASIAGTGATIDFVDVSDVDYSGLPQIGYITTTMFARLLIPQFTPPQWQRAIYLDADVLAFTDIAELWEQDLAGNLVGAVEDDLVTVAVHTRWAAQYAAAGKPGLDKAFFNSGVMLIDLAGWRRERIGERALDFARHDPASVTSSDQEALNVTMAGRWQELDPAWNVSTHYYLRPRSRRRFAETLRNVKLRHFTTQFKPWLPVPRVPGAEEFFTYLDRTAWTGWRPAPEPVAAG
nr:glycosyltransferase family 8 protein [Dactylosporangium thailandense]